MEEALVQGTLLNEACQLWNIKDGTAITKIFGPDSKVFLDGLKRSDLQLAWSLSIDWFNPLGNRTAGKKKFVGSIAMAILNLPPSLHYKLAFIWWASYLGPRNLHWTTSIISSNHSSTSS